MASANCWSQSPVIWRCRSHIPRPKPAFCFWELHVGSLSDLSEKVSCFWKAIGWKFIRLPCHCKDPVKVSCQKWLKRRTASKGVEHSSTHQQRQDITCWSHKSMVLDSWWCVVFYCLCMDLGISSMIFTQVHPLIAGVFLNPRPLFLIHDYLVGQCLKIIFQSCILSFCYSPPPHHFY